MKTSPKFRAATVKAEHQVYFARVRCSQEKLAYSILKSDSEAITVTFSGIFRREVLVSRTAK